MPNFTHWAIPSPPSGKTGDFFSLENMKQKISGLRGTKHIWGRVARPKIGGLNKPMHAKSWLTPPQVLFLTWLPELKTYSCLISQSCVTWLILIQWAGEGMCRMGDSKKKSGQPWRFSSPSSLSSSSHIYRICSCHTYLTVSPNRPKLHKYACIHYSEQLLQLSDPG